MAASGAGLRIDCCGCLRRLYRHVDLVGVSLHFAPWDQCHVLAQPDQLWADRGLCLFPRSFGVPYPSLEARITHNLTALVGFTFVVYVIQRYVKQRELLDKASTPAARSTSAGC